MQLVFMLLGLGLVIASACVFNNYLDRKIDTKMDRTKKRALVTKTIPVKNAIIFGVILCLVGFITLLRYTNFLTVIVALIGFLDYVFLYGYFKRKSVHGTVVGSISGATPILAGYVAATNRLDIGALLVFLILVFWQMPHFYAIAIFRLKDYKAAGIPVLPAVKGIFATKIQMVLYILGFTGTMMLLRIVNLTGNVFFILSSLLGLSWLWVSVQGFFTTDQSKWARKTFFSSLIVILLFSLFISIDVVLR